MFSFLLSFIIDLYNFNPLTPNPNKTGTNNRLCKNNDINTNIRPLLIPIILMHADIVKPKQNPLYNIIPNTIGIPNNRCSKKPYSKS